MEQIICNVRCLLFTFRIHAPKSKVWKNFKKIDDSQGKCKLCLKTYQSKGNTKNYSFHLQRMHPDEFLTLDSKASSTDESSTDEPQIKEGAPVSVSVNSEKKKTQQVKISKVFKKKSSYPTTHSRKIALDKALIQMIVKDFQPLRLVDDQGFRNFVELLDPKYQLPSRPTVSNSLLPDTYKATKTKVIQKLEICDTMVSLTMDIWTSLSNHSYLGITVHFIDSTFRADSAILATREMKGSTSAIEIQSQVKNVKEEFKIEQKIRCIVTDGGSNVKLACDLLNVKNIRCFAHNLNLTVMNALKKLENVNDTLTKCKKIVNHFNKSGKSSNILRDTETEMGTKQYKLIQQVETRWNSLFYMVKRIVELFDVVVVTLSKIDNPPPMLTSVELNLLMDIKDLLEIFETSTRLISGEKYCTISLVLPIINELQTQISLKKDFHHESGPQLQKILLGLIKENLFKYEDTKECLLGTILDPRFKKHGFPTSSGYSAAKKALTEEVSRIIQIDSDEKLTKEVGESEIELVSDRNLDTMKSFFSATFQNVPRVSRNKEDASFIVRNYLHQDNISLDGNPLEYWLEFKNNNKSSVLPKIAQEILSIPATSTPSERLFSTAGYIVNKRRAKLKPENVEMLTFLQKNIEV